MRTFNYARALKVPYLIQKLYKGVSFYKPIRLIAIGLFFLSLLISAIIFQFLIVLMNGLGLSYLLVYGVFPYVMMKVLLDIETDGKQIFIYLYDLLRFYWRFGWRYKTRTIEHEPVYLEEVIIFDV